MLISIVMPIYNPGIYLYTSLNTILEQSYRNFELICIDDASIDNSYNILCEYAQEDDRIKVYRNEENCGAAVSRNRGIGLASGEYILFVDADDIFENQLLERIVDAAEKQVPDIVFINYDIFQDNANLTDDNRHGYYFFSKLLSSYLYIKDCPKEYVCDLQLAPYSKLYKKEFIKKNKLKFQNLKNSNDIYFGLIATFLSKKIAHTEKNEYLIHVREHGGEFRISNNKDPFNYFIAYQCLIEEMQKRKVWDTYGTIVQEKFIRGIMYELVTNKKEMSSSFYSFLQVSGFKQMLVFEDSYYKKLSLTSQKMLNLFKTKSYEDMLRLYNNMNWFSTLIEENEKMLVELFEKLEHTEEKYALWGAGKNGKILAEFCAKRKYNCQGIIDNDIKKINTFVYGYKVYSPMEILGNITTVIILNQNHFNEICDQVSKACINISLLSLDLYLRYKIGLDESRYTINNQTANFRLICSN